MFPVGDNTPDDAVLLSETLNEQDRVDAWRLVEMVTAYSKPCTLEDIDKLGKLARSRQVDLHVACSALRHGQTIEQVLDLLI